MSVIWRHKSWRESLREKPLWSGLLNWSIQSMLKYVTLCNIWDVICPRLLDVLKICGNRKSVTLLSLSQPLIASCISIKLNNISSYYGSKILQWTKFPNKSRVVNLHDCSLSLSVLCCCLLPRNTWWRSGSYLMMSVCARTIFRR